MIARVGVRDRAKRTAGDMNSKQYAATKPNWTKVKVTGYRNWLRMTLPVLEESAEDEYQQMQSSTNRIASADRIDDHESPEGGRVVMVVRLGCEPLFRPNLRSKARRRRWNGDDGRRASL